MEEKKRTNADFNYDVAEWMSKENFKEVYRTNHPTETSNEIHYIGDGIRCVCVRNFHEEYAYLTSNTIARLPKSLSIMSSKFDIGNVAELNSNLLWIMINVTLIKKHWRDV